MLRKALLNTIFFMENHADLPTHTLLVGGGAHPAPSRQTGVRAAKRLAKKRRNQIRNRRRQRGCRGR